MVNQAVCNIPSPVSMDAASSKAGACHSVNTDRPDASSRATSCKPRVTSVYRQKYRQVCRGDRLCAREPPGASNAFRRSDPDGPEKSCSGVPQHPSTRFATCPRQSTRTPQSPSRVLAPTQFRCDPTSPWPSSAFVLRPSVSNGPCDGCTRRCPAECLLLPKQAQRNSQSRFQPARDRRYAQLALLRATDGSKVDWCAQSRRAIWSSRCACESARRGGRSRSELSDLLRDCLYAHDS